MKKGNSKKMRNARKSNNRSRSRGSSKEKNIEKPLKTVLCNFDKELPQIITFTSTGEKCGIKIEVRLKKDEEYLFYPCDSLLADRDDLFSAAANAHAGSRILYIQVLMRPSIPGRGSDNSYFLTVFNTKTGQGSTYKVGILNVIPDMTNKVISYFVKCKVTDHYIWSGGKRFPNIESFIDVPLGNFLERLPHMKAKLSTLPTKYRNFKPVLPKRPRAEDTARNVFFDPFEGRGIAITSENVLCYYGISYLETKRASIFPKFGEVFDNFFSVPLHETSHPKITHVAVRAKAYADLNSVNKSKKTTRHRSYNEQKLNQLFDIRSFYSIGEIPRFSAMLSKVI